MNKGLKTLGLAGLLLLSLGSCKFRGFSDSALVSHIETKERTLQIKTSEFSSKRTNDWDGFFVQYHGMIGKETFSISGGTDSINAYYPTNSKVIVYHKSKFNVIKVTPEELTLEYLGN